MKKTGTIIRFFEEKPKRYFKICKDCPMGKLCKKTHVRIKKLHLQKIKEDGQIVYSFKSTMTKKLKPINKDKEDFKDLFAVKAFNKGPLILKKLGIYKLFKCR